MKSPTFWLKQSSSLWAELLQPVAKTYGRIVQKRATRKPRYKSALPVICVGNVTMGGSGKTPVVQAIAKLLQQQGKTPAILMRGYGGSKSGAYWATPEMKADECGDEALLHLRVAPVMVSPDRVTGAQQIEYRGGISHIIMDDGLQNPDLHKTASFIVIDGKNPFGNGRIFPAGPLRETLQDGLRRASAVVVLGEDRTDLVTQLQFVRPVFRATLRAVNGDDFRGKPVLAFAGIGAPEKFFQTLRDCDAVVADTESFPDHYPYEQRDLAQLMLNARRIGAQLVTTRKDWVRLPEQVKPYVSVLDVEIVWQDEQAIIDFLRSIPSY